MLVNMNGVETLYYGYTDNQGSLIALTDASGNVVEKYAYDPWGARRNPNDWTQNDSRTSFINNRGYTGHEHLDAFGIINMNGRVYDPLTAQFFSPDPFVQAPDNWVNYNRYGYCMNNPLIYTDPTGNLMAWRSLKEGATYQQATSWECGGGIGGGGFDGMSSSGAPGGGYSYNYATGTYLNSAGEGVCYNEAFDNYILPNASYYFSGKSAQTAFSYTRDGFSLYSIKFSSGYTSYAASIGDIGKATMDSNGGLSFSNSTAGMISMSMWDGSGEGKGFSDFVSLSGTIGDLIGSGAKNILDDRGAYMPSSGIYKADIPITIKTPFLNINSTSKVLNYARIGSKALVVAGVLATGYQVGNDIVNGNYYSAGTRAAVFGVAAGAACIPVVGWAVAGGIGVADFIWGDQFYNYVQTNLGD